MCVDTHTGFYLMSQVRINSTRHGWQRLSAVTGTDPVMWGSALRCFSDAVCRMTRSRLNNTRLLGDPRTSRSNSCSNSASSPGHSSDSSSSLRRVSYTQKHGYAPTHRSFPLWMARASVCVSLSETESESSAKAARRPIFLARNPVHFAKKTGLLDGSSRYSVGKTLVGEACRVSSARIACTTNSPAACCDGRKDFWCGRRSGRANS